MTPHGYCYLWNSSLVWLHSLSDAIIGVSYLIIPTVIIIIRLKETEATFNRIIVLFAAFISLCGLCHLFSIWNIFHSDYWQEGVIKGSTAIVSLITALVMIQVGKSFNRAIQLTRLIQNEGQPLALDLGLVSGNLVALKTYYFELIGLLSLYQIGIEPGIILKYALHVDFEFMEEDIPKLLDSTEKALARLRSRLI